MYDVIVAGVGSMGSAAVYHLARRGRRVLGLDRFDVPNALGAAAGVNRIIRLAYAEHPGYVPLLRRAYGLWRELESISGERLLLVTGGLDVGAEGGDIISGSLRSCAEHDLSHEVLDAAELRRRFPAYALPSSMVAVYQPDAGFLMSERCIAAYVNASLALGAEIHGREAVSAWEPAPDGVRVLTHAGQYRARALVLAAGPWISSVAPAAAPLVAAERQVLLWAQPRKPERFQIDTFPVFNMDAPEGRYYGFPAYHVPGFKIGKYHHRRERVSPDTVDRECHPEDEAVLREAIRRYFPDADGPTLAMKVCLFANTPDEHFLVDTYPGVPQVVVTAGFSGHGFKFASVVGEIAADLAIHGRTGHDVTLFRLERFDAGDPSERTARPKDGRGPA